MKTATYLLLLLIPFGSISKCLVVGNFKGMSATIYSSPPGSQYRYSEDGMTKQYFAVNTDPKNPSVTPGDLIYAQLSENAVIGLVTGNNQTNIETWVISTDQKHVYYTQSRSGFGDFDGSKSFIGDVVGPCK
ncbi:hypothetical protein GTU79_19540 [Sodalis ligni]|uniref:hypothetical protein n=1 Tax=Sodalis ligni TaxID=2697027 RepID=UPI00193EFE5A|nr:hypothetical protein [Sodalis ligni]QWA09536.1 hypothetical protein GTU79_19540 [Sodalis ligni]